jgi:hypothetical protein
MRRRFSGSDPSAAEHNHDNDYEYQQVHEFWLHRTTIPKCLRRTTKFRRTHKPTTSRRVPLLVKIDQSNRQHEVIFYTQMKAPLRSNEAFPTGPTVRVTDRAFLENFIATWM